MDSRETPLALARLNASIRVSCIRSLKSSANRKSMAAYASSMAAISCDLCPWAVKSALDTSNGRKTFTLPLRKAGSPVFLKKTLNARTGHRNLSGESLST
eukprot:GHVU01005239.1.p2 GENE.GHVU01005239.1~~GHVU01005239.1.p2  ORF type:complete len:100 (+),score=0.78 GHVU01005239.1:258-557(+)